MDEEEILIVFFNGTSTNQSDAFLEQKGLVTPAAKRSEALQVYADFINAHYELYGRTITFKEFEGDCPDGPLDYQKCLASANEVIKMEPFMVIWQTVNYEDVFDLWANAGIVAIGGATFEKSLYDLRRPFRYELFMDGTTSADFLSDYYCKKMVDRPPDRAGTTISARVGHRASVQERKLGIVVPELPVNRANAERVIAQVNQCGGAGSAVDSPYTYSADINIATTQTEATAAALAADGVTTVVCMCDPIFPVFLTEVLTDQEYFPEHLLPGSGVLDFDTVAQLYDQDQWVHAFGPSQLPILGPLDESEPVLVWQAMGREGRPCGNENCAMELTYMTTAATMIQQAGPNLNPSTLETAALSNMPPFGGEGRTPLSQFGPEDYTLWSDAKEVYWDPLATTPIDGSEGAYVTVSPGCDNRPVAHTCTDRFESGEWDEDLRWIPVNP